MLTKTKLIEQIKILPSEFSIDELIDRLIVMEKVELGDKQSENGNVLTEAEMDNEITTWFE